VPSVAVTAGTRFAGPRCRYEQMEIGSLAHQWGYREGAFGDIVDMDKGAAMTCHVWTKHFTTGSFSMASVCLPCRCSSCLLMCMMIQLFTMASSVRAWGARVAQARPATASRASVIAVQRGSWGGACLYFVLPRRALGCMDAQ
jgi:hypothetical protein